MLRLLILAAFSSLLLACQPELPVANAAEAGTTEDPEYMNPNPRAPYSEGVRLNPLRTPSSASVRQWTGS